MRIIELEPIKERYEPPVGDVLTKEPVQQKWVNLSVPFSTILFILSKVTFRKYRDLYTGC